MEVLQLSGICRHYISAIQLPRIRGGAGFVLHPVSKRLEPDPMCRAEGERKHEGLAVSFQTYFALFAARQFGCLEHADASPNNIVACKSPGEVYRHHYAVVVQNWDLLPPKLRGENGIQRDQTILAELQFQSDRHVRVIDWGKWNKVDPKEDAYMFNDVGKIFCKYLPTSNFWSWTSLTNNIGGLIATMRRVIGHSKFVGDGKFYIEQQAFPLACPGIVIRHHVERIDMGAYNPPPPPPPSRTISMRTAGEEEENANKKKTKTKKRARECDIIDEDIGYCSSKRREQPASEKDEDLNMYRAFGKMKSQSCGL